MSRRRRASKELRSARHLCERAFEPLWRPAPWITRQRPHTPEERAEIQANARAAALAWLASQLGIDTLNDFSGFADIPTLRRVYGVIARATINDVRKWQNDGARTCQQ